VLIKETKDSEQRSAISGQRSAVSDQRSAISFQPSAIGDLGLFDTNILSAKAREAGFTLAVCRDLFIHHLGTRTFCSWGECGD
jgi:hypothetical protein